MIISEERPIIAGRELHRLILSPDDAPRAGLIFLHGQGDYIDRYPVILELFVKAGFQCILTDLPGHGRSPGRRGDIPSMALVEEVLQSSLTKLSGPIMIAGHSMGGLLALHFLLRYPHKFFAAWCSSPLLDPMRQAKPWMRRILPLFSKIFPWLTLSTGVRSEDCGDQARQHNEEAKALYHSRISLAWGLVLRDTAEQVRAQFSKLPPDIPILFTQGDLDPVCPAEILKTQLNKLSKSHVSYQEILGARHEPFTGSTERAFLNQLEQWIARL